MTLNSTDRDTVQWQGTRFKTLLDGADTNGQMSVLDTVSPPKSGPPLHVHHDADETFIALSGDIEMIVGGKRFSLSPGQAAFVPRGVDHTFRVTSDKPSRHLIILTPGGFEGFFAEMAKHQYKIPEDMEPILAAGKKYHLDFTGPPLEVL